MQQHLSASRHSHSIASRPIASFVALVAMGLGPLGGCAHAVRDMGENHGDGEVGPVPAHSRCASSPALIGDVTVENQQQLNELEGCQTIEGSLTVVPYEGADLRPLHALQHVTGMLAFSRPGPEGGWVMRVGDNCYTYCPEGEDNHYYEDDEGNALYEAGWLTSLEGLESLETAGGLRIMGYSGADLEPLARLRELTDSGYLRIGICDNLVDLSGLRNVKGIENLDIGCDGLETLAGLPLPSEINTLRISGKKLSDLGAFGVRRVGAFFELRDTALTHLDALASLESVTQDLLIMDNPMLADISGLDSVVNLGGLNVSSTGRLVQFPALSSLVQMRSLAVLGNPMLTDMSLLHQAHHRRSLKGSHLAQDPAFAHLAEYIEISNPELVSFSVPLHWQETRSFRISGAKLRHIDVGSLERVMFMGISQSPSLETVDLGKLRTVNELTINNNGAFDASVFQTVRTFDSFIE